MTRLPRTVDQLLATMQRRTESVYLGLVRCRLLGEDCQASLDQLTRLTARALVIADLAGRKWHADHARRGGIEMQFDTIEAVNEIGAAERQYAKLPAAEKILGMPLSGMARAFRLFVPHIVQRILQAAAASTSQAAGLWAQESIAILTLLTPVLQHQLTRRVAATEEVGLRSFFEAAENKLARTQFNDVARSRLETIYRTNLSTAANQAVKSEAHTPAMIAVTPLYEYLAVDDGSVRPHHWAFDGLLMPATWEGWHALWPPNDFNCRCSPPVSIYPREARRRGFMYEDGRLNLSMIRKTWRKAISAGLLTQDGQLTHRVVQMIDRQGRKVRSAMPAAGFAA